MEAATDLSARYVSDRFLPDKAIDLVDEASSRVRMYKNPIGEEAKDVVYKLRSVRKELRNAEEEQIPAADLENLKKPWKANWKTLRRPGIGTAVQPCQWKTSLRSSPCGPEFL